MKHRVKFGCKVHATKCWQKGTPEPCLFLRSRDGKDYCCMFGPLTDERIGWPYRHKECIEQFGGSFWGDLK